MENAFFDNWQTLWRTLIIGGLAYLTLLILLRISGRRTLSKMNAFDFVVTVSLGSTLATILLNKNVALAEGALALALLIGMQFIVTWTSVRVSWFKKLITGEPALLFYHGQHLNAALKHCRVTREEIEAAARSAGFDDFSEIGAIVLETDGSFSVLKIGNEPSRSTLRDLSTLQNRKN